MKCCYHYYLQKKILVVDESKKMKLMLMLSKQVVDEEDLNKELQFVLEFVRRRRESLQVDDTNEKGFLIPTPKERKEDHRHWLELSKQEGGTNWMWQTRMEKGKMEHQNHLPYRLQKSKEGKRCGRNGDRRHDDSSHHWNTIRGQSESKKLLLLNILNH